jgi:hypothetical protein
MKVADIYYQQMEKPDRDYTNAQRAEQEYRDMINMFPDSSLVPRAKQKLRDVQEVLAERETEIGLYYESRENFAPPSPASRRWSIPIRSTPRATRRCWASAMPTPARRTIQCFAQACPARSRSGCFEPIKDRPLKPTPR